MCAQRLSRQLLKFWYWSKIVVGNVPWFVASKAKYLASTSPTKASLTVISSPSLSLVPLGYDLLLPWLSLTMFLNRITRASSVVCPERSLRFVSLGCILAASVSSVNTHDLLCKDLINISNLGGNLVRILCTTVLLSMMTPAFLKLLIISCIVCINDDTSIESVIQSATHLFLRAIAFAIVWILDLILRNLHIMAGSLISLMKGRTFKDTINLSMLLAFGFRRLRSVRFAGVITVWDPLGRALLRLVLHLLIPHLLILIDPRGPPSQKCFELRHVIPWSWTVHLVISLAITLSIVPITALYLLSSLYRSFPQLRIIQFIFSLLTPRLGYPSSDTMKKCSKLY